MLDINDIEKLTEFQKEIFSTKDDLNALETRLDRKFDKLQTSVDEIAKITNVHGQEITAHNHHFQEIDDVLGKAGSKIGLDFRR